MATDHKDDDDKDNTTTNTPDDAYDATLLCASNDEDPSELAALLHETILSCSVAAIQERGVFTLALSGGSLPRLLAGLAQAFESLSIDPQFEKWHVCLADERLVDADHADSNARAVREQLSDAIPPEQLHGLDATLLASSEDAAAAYERDVVQKMLDLSDGTLDCAVLGFGPDGHTCSLFPGHALLSESKKLVAHLDDSPKPPSSRITLTLPVLNDKVRCVVFCGAGASKNPVLRDCFASVVLADDESGDYHVTMQDTAAATYPCAAVKPKDSKVIWIVDGTAVTGLIDMDDDVNDMVNSNDAE